MTIIALSDLNWDLHLRHMTVDEMRAMNEIQVQKSRYDKIRKYYELITSQHVDLVLFAGDVTGDGSCGHGYTFAFLSLLYLLEQKEIRSAFISGNHDPDHYYQPVCDMVKDWKYTQEISDQLVEINGLKILGVNYHNSKSKRKLKASIEGFADEKIDIVLAHSQIKRRIYHFDFDTRYIITGHYDRKLLMHRDSTFIALDNDSEEISYGLLQLDDTDLTGGKDIASICIQQSNETSFRYSAKISNLREGIQNSILYINDQAAIDLIKLENASDASLSRDGEHYLYLKYLRGINYKSSLDTMYRMKTKEEPSLSDLSLNQLHGLPITANYQVSESMIEDYLGNVID